MRATYAHPTRRSLDVLANTRQLELVRGTQTLWLLLLLVWLPISALLLRVRVLPWWRLIAVGVLSCSWGDQQEHVRSLATNINAQSACASLLLIHGP